MKLAVALLLSLLVAAPALAGSRTPKIREVKGAVEVGKEGAWRTAAKDMAIADDEFVRIPADATVVVVLPDGKATTTFTGKRIVPGRRLSKASGDVFLSDAVRAASKLLAVDDGVSSTPGATKNCSDEDRRLGKCTGSMAVEWDTESNDIAQVALGAERSLLAGDVDAARIAALRVLSAQTAAAADRARAHWVLAEVAATDAGYGAARTELDSAVAEAGGPMITARALLSRARISLDLGDAAKATGDLKDAIQLDASGATGQRALFFLAVIALESGDRERAKSLLANITGDSELQAAGLALIGTR